MRSIQQLVHSRVRVTPRYALMPLEGFPFSRLPGWPGAEVRVLASPRLGAGFVQHLIDLPMNAQGAFPRDDSLETFHYVTSGEGDLLDGDRVVQQLSAGAFGLSSDGDGLRVSASSPLQLLLTRKRYEPTPLHPSVTPHYGHTSEVTRLVWNDDPGSIQLKLLPDDDRFDLAMNVFEFSPGHGLPIVETHVMEHGALMLAGKGLYFLNGDWMEVEKDDFIWMAAYCPQSFYAAGPTLASYIYYKNVNREIQL